MDIADYKRVFYPERIVLVGASANSFKFGGMYLQAQLAFGFKGRIFPVNPKGGEIHGLQVYRSILEIAEPVDLAVITVPAPEVTQAVRDCITIGVKGLQILTAGFGEQGDSGARLEKEISEMAKTAGVKLIGPNCFGVYSPQAGLTLLPGTSFPKAAGKVGLFSQSGGGACDVIHQAYGRNVRFSLAVSFGNGAGIGSEEMLEYFTHDPSTEIVGGYVEGIKDGPRFRKALKACAAKKPVVILKAGLTEQGQRGTIGHTGSLAGFGEVWQSVIRSCGAIPAYDLRDLSECLMALQCLNRFQGTSVGILAGGGARVVEALDTADKHGFDVPELDSQTQESLQAMLPESGARAANPVDLANPFLMPEIINPAMEALARFARVDFLILHQILFYSLDFYRHANDSASNAAYGLQKEHEAISIQAQSIARAFHKPLAVVLADVASDPGHIEMEHGRLIARQHYTANKIPCFDGFDQAFSVLQRISGYYNDQPG